MTTYDTLYKNTVRYFYIFIFLIAITGTFHTPVAAQNNNSNDLVSTEALSSYNNVIEVQELSDISLALDKMVSLEVKGASVLDALQQIAEQTGLKLAYSSRLLTLNKILPSDVTATPAREALAIILDGTALKYAISRNGHLILMDDERLRQNKESSLPSSITNMEKNNLRNYKIEIQPQEETVEGRVTDAGSGESLPGVNIVVKGTNIGTATDLEGNYELDNVPTLQDTLVFSFVGYQRLEVPIAGRTEINVEMQSSAVTGDELVVIGYGTVRKSDITGSVSSVSVEEAMESGTFTNVDQLLQGRIAGVKVTQSSAAPGGGVSIRIRGSNSVNADNEPLYVIDGQPIENNPGVAPDRGQSVAFFSQAPASNPLNSLNPNDIESIEVLKDASAAAIYGSRGANGVILITTKKGRGDLQVDFATTTSVQKVANKIELLSASEFMMVQNELAVARGNDKLFSDDFINSVGNGTDWLDEILRTKLRQDYNISASLGDENSSFFASFNYSQNNGIVTNSGLDRIQGRVNYEYQKNKGKFGISLSSAQLDESIAPVSGGGNNVQTGAMNSAVNAPPVFPVFNEDGSFFQPTAGTNFSVTLDNPVAIAEGATAERRTNRFFGNIFAEYELIPGLLARVRLGGDVQRVRSDAFNSTVTFRGRAQNGIAQIKTSEDTNFLIESTINYTTSYKEHNINVLAGYTFEDFESRNFTGELTNFPSDLLGTSNIGIGSSENDLLNSTLDTSQLISFFGRINYNFSDRYILTTTIRADGSSKFGENERFGVFPSIALAWNSLEGRSIDGLSELKLRASWGRTGNERIGSGKPFSTFSGSGNVLFGETTFSSVAPVRISNPDLKWETTRQYSVGIDYGLFEQRVTGSFEYFNKSTTDMLFDLPVPLSTGFGFVTRNTGKISNTGFEISLNSINISNKDFIWRTSFNVATLNNKVKDTGPVPQFIASAQGFSSDAAIVRPGLPLFAYFGFQAEGIFQEGDDIANSAQPNAIPGAPRWKDVNGDGQITGEDRVNLGDPIPDYTFGISNTFSYKRFDLNIFFEGAQGQQLVSRGMRDTVAPNEPFRNSIAEPLLNRWTPENPTNKYPSFVSFEEIGDRVVNSFTVEDASYIRLRNVRFTYRFPVQNINLLRHGSVYVSGENLLLITDYSGFDPDVNTAGQSNVVVDQNAFPRARTITFGVNLGF